MEDFFYLLSKRHHSSNKIHGNHPVLPEYVQKYNEHLRGLFDLIIQNCDALDSTSNYFDGLRKTTTKKRMIFQHFVTNALISQQYSNLYQIYRTSVSLLNDLEEKKKTTMNEISNFDYDIQNYSFEKKSQENWIQYSDLRSAMEIKKVNPIEAVMTKSFDIGYRFPDSVSFDFYIFENKENNEWTLGLKNNHFAGSKKKEDIEQLKLYIFERGRKLWNLVYEIKSGEKTLHTYSISWFNREFKELHESLEGDPSIGACNSCINWFNKKQSKEYKTVLDNFNNDAENYTESLWHRDESNKSK